jgi:hypothetical protein
VVQGQRALVVLLADLLDASGTLLGRVRQLVGEAELLPARPGWHRLACPPLWLADIRLCVAVVITSLAPTRTQTSSTVFLPP